MMNVKNVAVAVVAVLLAVGVLAWMDRGSVQAQQAGKGGTTGRYSVVETQGHNLLVTDNSTNTLYFYTTDKDAPIGSPLKLRASLDLSKVGDPEIKIRDYAKK